MSADTNPLPSDTLTWDHGSIALDSTMLFSDGYDYDLMGATSQVAEGRHGWYQVWSHCGEWALYRLSDGGFNEYATLAEAKAAAGRWDAEGAHLVTRS